MAKAAAEAELAAVTERLAAARPPAPSEAPVWALKRIFRFARKILHFSFT